MALFATASPLLRPDILIAAGLLAVLLIAGAAVILVAERWKRKAIASETKAQAADDLAEFRTMFDQGELTEEEYDKIRQRTAQRMKEELRIAPTPPPPPSTGPVPPPSLN